MKGPRVLIVEDEGPAAEATRLALEGLGYEVPSAVPTAEEALALADRIRPNLVLMDITLAGAMDGVEAAEKIQSGLDIPVVFLTAYTEQELIERAAAVSPYGYIVKPFKAGELHATLQLALHRKDREIRDRERAQEERIRAKKIWEEVFHASGHTTFILNPDYTIKQINQAGVEALGRTPAEIQGRYCYELMHEQDRPPETCPLRELIALKGRQRIQREMQALERTFLVSCAPILGPFGNLAHVVHVATDITEHKEVERALRESEERFTLAVLGSSDGLWDWPDTDRDEQWWSPRMYELLGYKDREIEASVRNVLELMHPEDKARATAAVRAHLKDRVPYDVEFRLKTKSGPYRWFRGRGQAIWDEQGRPKRMAGSIQDITERKKAEEELARERERLASIFDGIDEPIYVADPDTYELLYANSAVKAAFGKEVVGRKCYEVLQNLDAPCEFCTNPQIFGDHAGTPYVWEQQNRYNGRWYRCIDKAICWPDGRMVRYEMAIDIHDRKCAEAKFEGSEQKYRELVEDIEDVIYALDERGTLTYIGPAIESMTGYSPSEVIGRHYSEFIHSDDVPRVNRSFAHITSSKLRPIEYRLVGKTGEVRWVRVLSRPFYSRDRLAGVRGVITDITERKKAERMIRESELRFRSLFELNPQAVSLTDMATGTLIDVNDAFCEMTGYSRQEVLGRTAVECKFHSSEQRAAFVKELQRSGELRATEFAYRKRDGSILHGLTSARLIRIGDQTCILSIILDITKRRKLEAELRQAQKMEAIGTLAGGIAHDFNNILAAILGYAELAQVDAIGNARLQASLDEILRAGSRARDLVKQILSFSRQADQDKRPMRPYAVIKEALGLIRASLPSSIEIHQDLEARSSLVMADPTHLHQILMNLCANARDAMEDKPGILEVSLAETILRPDAATLHPDLDPGPYVKLTVSDTGCGIDPVTLEHIFDPFFTTKAPGRGTGMGLSVVHGIVKELAGAVRVSSEPGRGTTFEVLLPKLIPGTITEPRPDGPSVRRSGARILFVDDEPALISMCRQMLERLGHKVTTAASSIQALELFRAQPDRFDLVITDMSMPSLDGLDLARSISSLRPGIPILLCTGFSDTLGPEEARRAGVRRILMKPVLTAELAGVIQETLRDRAQEEQDFSLTVLVVDDEAPIRGMLRGILEQEGYRVLEAQDGKEALRVQAKESADLIILDIFMPEADGLETLRGVRKQYPSVPVIAISGGGRNVRGNYLDQARLLGADRTLSKPLARESLLAAVRDLTRPAGPAPALAVH